MKRQEALDQGLKHYDGKPCKNCGETLKFVSGWSCVRCVSESTANRSSEVYKRYIESDKGQEWLKEFRNSETNKSVQRRYRKKHYPNNKDWYKNHNLRQKYGITLEDYNGKLNEQNDCCAVCKKHKDLFKKGLVVDHCHETDKIRSLLCGMCNTALGLLQEDVDIMKNLIDYVELHR